MLGFVLHPFKKFSYKLKRKVFFKYNELFSDNLPTWACVDLGAFAKTGGSFPGIKTMVIMEDRDPNFFLKYNFFVPEQDTGLNRHGPLRELSTEQDLKNLVDQLHQQKIKVFYGFWGFWSKVGKRTDWLDLHPELKPLGLFESDINPLVELGREKISFAEFVGRQFIKLKKDFGFDGLFLGDGLNGYRSFLNPQKFKDKIKTGPAWAKFYGTIAKQVHGVDAKLAAYDCFGFSFQEARLHGADYKLEAEAGLDFLIFQSYPIAWGKYWQVPGKNLEKDLTNFLSIKEALKVSKTKLFYTLELGDSVEGWSANKKSAQKQMDLFAQIADGKMLVWANDLFAKV